MHHLHADVSDIHVSMKHFKCGNAAEQYSIFTQDDT